MSWLAVILIESQLGHIQISWWSSFLFQRSGSGRRCFFCSLFFFFFWNWYECGSEDKDFIYFRTYTWYLIIKYNMNAKLSIWLQCTSSSLWQFVLEGRYLFFMQYLPGGGGVQPFGKIKKKYGSGRFSGSGADDHQLVFFIWPYVSCVDSADWEKLAGVQHFVMIPVAIVHQSHLSHPKVVAATENKRVYLLQGVTFTSHKQVRYTHSLTSTFILDSLVMSNFLLQGCILADHSVLVDSTSSRQSASTSAAKS